MRLQPDGASVFDTLYRQHSQAAYGLAVRLTRNRAAADDAFQEAMLRIWRAIPSLRQQNVRGWIFRIVARECIRIQRRHRREAAHDLLSQSIHQHDSREDDIRSSMYTDLLSALAKLPPAERDLLKLSVVQGIPQRRISALKRIPQQTISQRLKRILAHLGRELNARAA